MPGDPGSVNRDEQLFDRVFEGTAEGVREAIAATKLRLAVHRATEEEVFSAELVLAETLNNVVEHALNGVDQPKFALRLRWVTRGLEIEIRDRGKPMPGGEPPIGTRPVMPERVEDIPEGGFGWFLIRELAHDLRYRRLAGENRLTFRLAICLTESA